MKSPDYELDLFPQIGQSRRFRPVPPALGWFVLDRPCPKLRRPRRLPRSPDPGYWRSQTTSHDQARFGLITTQVGNPLCVRAVRDIHRLTWPAGAAESSSLSTQTVSRGYGGAGAALSLFKGSSAWIVAKDEKAPGSPPDATVDVTVGRMHIGLQGPVSLDDVVAAASSLHS
jgi:hypothetical protein